MSNKSKDSTDFIINYKYLDCNHFKEDSKIKLEVKIAKEIKMRKKKNQTYVDAFLVNVNEKNFSFALSIQEELEKHGLKLKYCWWWDVVNNSGFSLEIVAIDHEYDSSERNKRLKEFKKSNKNKGGNLSRVCVNCKKKSRKMRLCTGCKVAAYCSEECQKKNWKLHKAYCKKIGVNIK